MCPKFYKIAFFPKKVKKYLDFATLGALNLRTDRK